MSQTNKPLELPNLREDVDDFILGILGGDHIASDNNLSLDYDSIEVNNEVSTQIDEDLNKTINNSNNNLNSSLNHSIQSPTNDIKNLYKTPTNLTPLQNLKSPSTITPLSIESFNTLAGNISPIHIYQTPSPLGLLTKNESSHNKTDISNKSNNSSTTILDTSSNKSDSITKNLLQEFSLELNNSRNDSNISNKSSDNSEIIANVLDNDFEFESTQQPTLNTQQTQNPKKTKRVNYDLVTGKPTRPLKMIKGYLTPIKNNNSTQTTPVLKTVNNSSNNNNNNNNNNNSNNNYSSIPSFQTLLKNHLTSTNKNEDDCNLSNTQNITKNTQAYDLLNSDIIPPPVTQYSINRCFDEGGSDDENDNSDNDDICPICQEAFNDPHESPCHHKCCLECWQKWLSLKLECPVCRERTRIKQLKKL